MFEPSALASLTPVQRDALVVLALDAIVPRSRTAWQQAVATAGIVDARGRKIAGEDFKELVSQLEAASAITVNERQEHRLADGWLGPLLDDAQRRGRLEVLARRMRGDRRYGYADPMQSRSDLLVGLATGDELTLRNAETTFRIYGKYRTYESFRIVNALGLDVPSAWLERLEPTLRTEYLSDATSIALALARRLGADVREAARTSEDEDVRARIAMLAAMAGEAAAANAVLERGGKSQWTRGARGFVALTEGRLAEARALFAAAGLGARGQRVELPGELAVFDVLLAVTSDRAEEVADVERRLARGKRQFAHHFLAEAAIGGLAELRRMDRTTWRSPPGRDWVEALVVMLASVWVEREIEHRDLALSVEKAARDHGYTWVADELERVASGRREGSLLALWGKKAGWELALDALAAAAAAEEAAATTPKAAPQGELWWTVGHDARMPVVSVEASLVTPRALKGKRLAPRRVLDGADGAASETDMRVAREILAARDAGYHLAPLSVLLPLVGHPRVRDEHGLPLEVVKGEPRLQVRPTRDGATVSLVPGAFDPEGLAVAREKDRLVVYKRTPALERVRKALPPGGLEVPREGQARLFEVLSALGDVPVEASASLAKDTQEGDPRVHVQLFRAGAGLRARLRVVPAGPAGPALRPGAPPEETVVSTGKGLVRLRRDLAAERARVEALLERCPTLACLPQEGDDRIARELETCLEVLVELREAEADVVIDWLEGQPLRAPAVRGASHLRFNVRGDDRWLAVEGELRVDEERVLAMSELLAQASRAVGRFVPIGEDQYVALTEDVRRKVEALGRMQGLGKDGRLSTALLPAMEGLLDGVEVSFTEKLAKRRAALEGARELAVKVPRGLETELRDYQREGFLFLARRAEAGLGACLADDMGLGKTVQALALLLHRKKKGPALVIAPTSVCRNWEDEARRFAPSLTVHRLASGDRGACVADAGPGDVVVASYGLLASEQELLASRAWATVVYDEAHALKNASTRRWAAASAMRADAVVALTGTPVENHASELHALFDLLVPGMLGSRLLFDRALGGAIAEGDREAAALLRQLVRPFVLRRTKAQVLTELPPKTEVLQVVPPSAEHRAFYEAVRRRAVEKMDGARKARGAGAGRARIELLAEIMRLRRAAIDPRLVGGEQAPAGAKLDALVEMVAELREEGRRALVFSQFLEVLDMARARLEERGLTCRRLDGTMSAAARADEVAAFQDGHGDVFLVSLKAGGVGMNLTAADVVILLDPWWNPAVEDQAAGRAHRIGQVRPVTVARIVTEGTIEERVLALHEKKRRLYEDVVADADGAGTLDVDALAALLDGAA